MRQGPKPSPISQFRSIFGTDIPRTRCPLLIILTVYFSYDAVKTMDREGGPAIRFLPAGGDALVVELGDRIDAGINDAVHALDRAIGQAGLPGVLETTPSYRSILVSYDPLATGFAALRERIAGLAPEASGGLAAARRIWQIPVAYGGAFGVDLEAVARDCGLGAEAFAAQHSATEYRVYMLGFAPGFAYLGDLPRRLHASRWPEPRPVIPSGSVSIGGAQSAISSVDMPSAWRLIGRTPVRLFDLQRPEAFLLRPGDRVRLRPIGAPEFDELAQAAARGETVAVLESPAPDPAETASGQGAP